MPRRPKPLAKRARLLANALHKLPPERARETFQRFTRGQAKSWPEMEETLAKVSERLAELRVGHEQAARAQGQPFRFFDAFEEATAWARLGSRPSVFTSLQGAREPFIQNTRNQLTYFAKVLPKGRVLMLEYEPPIVSGLERRVYVHWTPEGLEKVIEEEGGLTVHLKNTYRARLDHDGLLHLTKE